MPRRWRYFQITFRREILRKQEKKEFDHEINKKYYWK